MAQSMNNFRRLLLPLPFWGVIVMSASSLVPAKGNQPGPLDTLLKWNAAHVRTLVDPLTRWWGINGGWWMFAHPYATNYDTYDYDYEFDVMDGSGVTHPYHLPPESRRTRWQRYLHFRQVSLTFYMQESPDALRNIMLWHVRQDMTLWPGRRPPFWVTCYTSWRLVNPPGSPAVFGPPQKTLIKSLMVNPDDMRCMEPRPSYDHY